MVEKGLLFQSLKTGISRFPLPVEESRCAERVAEGMETLLLLSPRLLVMWRVLATLTMAEALLEEHVDAAEKLLEGCRELTLSTLVYWEKQQRS